MALAAWGATRGVRIVNLQADDSVAALAVITHDDLTRGVDGGTDDETLAGMVGSNGEDGFITTKAVANGLSEDGDHEIDEFPEDELEDEFEDEPAEDLEPEA
ncbi:MAG: hypothetical protein R2867_07015 [Caldilineaceae bacterium]